MTTPTAGIILIGNELLSGQTQDMNVQYIALCLFKKGISLQEVIIIPDLEDEIIRVVRDYHKRFTYVFTTGGIGPTHDDITAHSLGKAFGVPCVTNREALEILMTHPGSHEIIEARNRMALMPEGASLIHNGVSGAPGFRIQNVFCMAGIPSVMQTMMQFVMTQLEKGPKIYKVIVFSRVFEGQIAAPLGGLQNQHPTVEIGSYPHWPSGRHEGLRIAISGPDETLVTHVSQQVMELCRQFNPEVQILEGGV
jgi:molybdenum cofactor synthesis domain-containing protein